jgi:poly(A) polymerase
MLVRTPSGHVEVATFRQDGPYLDGRHPSEVRFVNAEEDAQRRDFTINALFQHPVTGEIIDYVNGQSDLQEGMVRAVGKPEQRFREDYLRLLRAVRIASRLEFEIEPATFAAMQEYASLITKCAAERIRDELVKCLCEGHAKRAFELLDASGLLPHILPEITAMKGVEQPPEFHPEGNVFTHTLLMLEMLEPGCSPTLAMGTLLHDVGKPSTQTFEDRIRFNLHDKVGARMARDICRRLKFSKDDTDRIVWLVEHHMRTVILPEMRESKRRRFMREAGFEEMLLLNRYDCLSSHRNLDAIEWVEEYRATLKPEEIRPVPLLNGNDLIEMGYTPGARFKEILTAVEDAQLEGGLRSKEEAMAWVRGNYEPQINTD